MIEAMMNAKVQPTGLQATARERSAISGLACNRPCIRIEQGNGCSLIMTTRKNIERSIRLAMKNVGFDYYIQLQKR